MSTTTFDRPQAEVTTSPARRPSRRRLFFGLTLLLAVPALAWFGYDWWTVGRFMEETDDAYVGGNVTALSPHVDGFVSEILVTDNQRVTAGQLLIHLDPRDLEAALLRARATFNQRKATLASLKAQLELQHSNIAQASADVDAKTAQAAFARKDSERYSRLAITSAGSVQDSERTSSLDLQARSALIASKAAYAAAKQQLTVLDANISQATAAVSAAEADVRIGELNLGYTEIRSPVDGYIGNRAAQVGNYVKTGSYLLTVVPANGLWVDANFKEDQLGAMSPGQAASIVPDVMPNHEFHGHVASLAPGTGAIFSIIPPENATGNFTKIVQRVPVRIVLDAGDANLGQIRPGLSTTATVDTRRSSENRP
ncbi:MAG: HlyD family secretion protein [Hyphomicrobium sp.]|uniref:HlyD family secretion protein n=1 Tax=Hyphomicrobium sp. TaxID=82 RepID=UPI0039E58880